MASFFGLVLLLALQQPDVRAEGLKALEDRNYPAAVQFFTKAIEADPKDFSAHFNLGLAYSFLGKDAEAETQYRKTLELKPGLYEAELNLGIVLLREKRPQDAIAFLEGAANAKPAEARPKVLLGDALLAAGELPRAEQAYNSAAGVDAKSAAAELGLGRVLAREGRPADAEPHFRRAIELDPGYRESILELAEAWEKAGKSEQALAIYRQFPGNAAVRERTAQLLLSAGRTAEAIPDLEWAVQNSPTAANRLALAQAYRKNNQPEKAIAALGLAVTAEPDSVPLRMSYGRELRDARKFGEAAAQFYRVTQMKPDSVEAWNEFAAMLISLEQYPQALAALDRVRALGGETAGHIYLRAIVLDRTGQVKPALEAYQAFLAASNGRNPNEEFKARQRARILQKEASKR